MLKSAYQRDKHCHLLPQSYKVIQQNCFGGLLSIISTLVRRRHKREKSYCLMDETVFRPWQWIIPLTALSRPSREAWSSTTLRHERFGDVFPFLLLRLFINVESISSAEKCRICLLSKKLKWNCWMRLAGQGQKSKCH